jgi:anti-sigma regulatory factor (Ser/Thr protein kinase)
MRSERQNLGQRAAPADLALGVELATSSAQTSAQARSRIRAWLSASKQCAEDVVDTAELLVSELVSNAIRHTRARSVRIALARDGPRVRVGVEDPDGHLVGPPPPVPSVNFLHGRGLWLIDQLASRWGSHPRPDGKVVWFELECPETAEDVVGG